MILLAAGLAMVGLLLVTAGALARTSVSSVKALLAWAAALAGLSVVGLLLLSGRGTVAYAGLVLLGPLAWRFWQQNAWGPSRVRRQGAGAAGPMDRAEALSVLGLADGASEAEVREAWVRLMRVAHPDGGGSDWLASRVNQAKDVLLRQ